MQKQVVGTAVDSFGGDKMIAGLGEVLQGIGDGGGPGGDGQRGNASFECGNPAFKDVLGGVGQAAVDVARVGQVEPRLCVGRIPEYI